MKEKSLTVTNCHQLKMTADEGSETVTKCNRLKLVAEDGKMRLTDVDDPETLLRFMQFVKIKIASLLILFTLASCASAGELKPFTTDGCSDFPNGTPKHQDLWLTCCIQHDLAYWMGGTYKERLEADRELKACVAQVGEPTIAKIMLAGVRVGGTPFLPTPFRWGYGWKYSRGYKALTKEEREQVNKMLSGNNKE